MQKEISGVSLELRQGDIALQEDCEAVVNAANPELETGGGVAGAIHAAAGPQLAEEAGKMAPINPGEAVITQAYKLPNQYVIHCLGPVFGRDKPEERLLGNCYSNALDLAEKNKIKSIAFPSISTGAYGYPAGEAAEVAFLTILEKIPSLNEVKKIVFVLYNAKELEIHQKVLEQFFQGKSYPE